MERTKGGLVTFALAVALLACATIAMTTPTTQAHAVSASETLIYKSQGLLGDTTRLTIDISTLSGYSMTGTHQVKGTTKGAAGNSYQLKIASSKTASAQTKNNPLTLTFNKKSCGKVAGKDVYVVVKITKWQLTSGGKITDSNGYCEIGTVTSRGMTVGSYAAADQTIAANSAAHWKANVSIEVHYRNSNGSDGGVVNLPFFQRISDIDQKQYDEAWQMGSGFSGKYFRYDGSNISITKSSGMFKGNYAKGTDPTGDDSVYLAGIYAVTSGGSFSSVHEGGHSDCGIRVYSSYKLDTTPSKSASVSYAKPGETFTWSVTRSMGTYVENTLTPYNNIKFWDEIDPDKMEYVSAKMYSDGKDVTTSAGSLWREGSQNEWVNYQFSDSWRNDLNNYKGQTLKLVITVRLKDTTGTVSNTGTTCFCNGYDKSASASMRAKAPVRYYADGSNAPVYTDYVTWDDTYQVNGDATKAATRSDCAGLDGWYLGSFGSSKYSPKAPGSSGMNLYAKNWVDVRYAVTDTSYQRNHPNKAYYLDKARKTKVTSDSQILPADSTKQFHYGDTVTFGKGKTLYYKRQGKVRALDPSDGVYATPDATGDLFVSSPIYQSTTVYVDWTNASHYDGVYSS